MTYVQPFGLLLLILLDLLVVSLELVKGQRKLLELILELGHERLLLFDFIAQMRELEKNKITLVSSGGRIYTFCGNRPLF